MNDRAFRAAFIRYKFPPSGRLPFSAPTTTIGQLVAENESAACLSNGASCLRVRVRRKRENKKTKTFVILSFFNV